MKFVLYGTPRGLLPLLNRHPLGRGEVLAVPEAYELAARRTEGLGQAPRRLEPPRNPAEALVFWSRVLEGEVTVMVSGLEGHDALLLAALLARRARGRILVAGSRDGLPVGTMGRLAALLLGSALRPPYGRRKRRILRGAGLLRGRNLERSPLLALLS